MNKKKEVKWVNIEDDEESESTYRMEFSCFPAEFDEIIECIRGYGKIIKIERQE